MSNGSNKHGGPVKRGNSQGRNQFNQEKKKGREHVVRDHGSNDQKKSFQKNSSSQFKKQARDEESFKEFKRDGFKKDIVKKEGFKDDRAKKFSNQKLSDQKSSGDKARAKKPAFSQDRTEDLKLKYLEKEALKRDNFKREEAARKNGQVPAEKPEPVSKPYVLKYSPGVEVCPLARKCGSCQYQGLTYKEQLSLKQKNVEGLLRKFGKVDKIIGMENPMNYRAKVHAVYGHDKKRGLVCGTYEAGSHKLLAVEDCMLEDKKCQEILHTIRDLLRPFKIKTYDEDSGYGLFRHALIRRGFATGEIMVVLVLTSPILPGKNNFVKALLEKHPDITTIVLNVNDKDTSMVLGDKETVLYGPGFIRDTLCGITFRISPKSFFQVNPVQTEILYQKAIEFAGLTGNETVIDAYCGIGTIALCAAKNAGTMIGVELNKDAVRDAITNARENHVTNTRFIQGDAGEFMTAVAEEGNKVDVIFMDPPRSGSTEKFLDAVVTLSPKKVVYVSCGPDTLARDLTYITSKGYRVNKIQPVDMFPLTEHVETVCLLSKLSGAKNTIDVKVDMDELDVTSAETKATYEEIKAYVLEQTGLQVTNLYVAQVKRECGIIERENYNKPKSEDSRQPQCPEEKSKAIMEALKHFGMV